MRVAGVAAEARRLLVGSVSRMLYPDVCPACLARPGREELQWCPPCTDRLRVLPKTRCPGCGGAIDGVLAMCGECLSFGHRPWLEAVSVYAYGGYLRELVHRFKYRGATMLAPVFARRMATSWLDFGTDGGLQAITPVPLHSFKELQRGYNQAELLAEGVGRRLGLPVRRLLRRRGWSRQQAQLDLDQRRINVKGIFRVADPDAVEGLHVLLVDDVLTTGATLAAAADTLLAAKAASVRVLTLARG